MPITRVSEYYYCPIAQDIIKDPVFLVTLTGKAQERFDKIALEEWINKKKDEIRNSKSKYFVHPVNGEQLLLNSEGLPIVVSDIGFQQLLEEFKKKHVSGRNEFFEAVRNNDVKKLVYDVWYTPDDVKAVDPKTKLTALEYAIKNNLEELVKHILEEAKDLNLLDKKNSDDNIPFYQAMATGNKNIIGAVLRAFKNKAKIESFIRIYEFCKQNKLNFIDFLKQNDLDILQLKTEGSNMPLLYFLLIDKKDIELAEQLLKENSDSDIKYEDKTLLEHACQNKDIQVIQLLLKYNTRVSDFEVLFKAYPDINFADYNHIFFEATDDNIKKLFQLVVERKDINLLKIALKNEVEIQSYQQLYNICKAIKTNIIELLSEFKYLNSLPVHRDTFKKTLLDIAYINHDKKLARHILSNNATQKAYAQSSLAMMRYLSESEKSAMLKTIVDMENIQKRDTKVMEELITPAKEALIKAQSAPEKLVVLFSQFANPAYLSSGRFDATRTKEMKKTATKTAEDFKTFNTWNSEHSKNYIRTNKDIQSHVFDAKNKLSTFKGMLSFIKKTDFDKPLFADENNNVTQNKRR